MLIFEVNDECFNVVKKTTLFELTAINFIFCMILYFVGSVFLEWLKYLSIGLFFITLLFIWFGRSNRRHVTFSLKGGVIELSPMHKKIKNLYPISSTAGICLVEKLIIKDFSETSIFNHQMVVYLSSLDEAAHRSILSGVSKTPEGQYYAAISLPKVDIYSLMDLLKKYYPENRLNAVECLEFKYGK